MALPAEMSPQTVQHALIAVPWSRDSIDELVAALDPHQVTIAPTSGHQISSALRTADVAIIGKNADARFVEASQLRWLHIDHAGIDGFAPPGLFRDRVVTTSAGRSAPALADHAMYLMLALVHDQRGIELLRRRRAWSRRPVRRLAALHGARVLVIGCGQTGRAIAHRCHTAGMHVTGVRRSGSLDLPGFDRVVHAGNWSELSALLAATNVLVLAAPLNNDTHHLIGASELEALPTSALLINMGRGGLVDQPALVQALRSGQIAGAGLDVADPEPLPPWSPLWRLRNTVITPHLTPALIDKERRSLDIVLEVAEQRAAGIPVTRALSEVDAYTLGQQPSRLSRGATRAWLRVIGRTLPRG
ncbi:MAG: NAD(P)-dependent oxidoreductase [Actinomycetota bacterium]